MGLILLVYKEYGRIGQRRTRLYPLPPLALASLFLYGGLYIKTPKKTRKKSKKYNLMGKKNHFLFRVVARRTVGSPNTIYT